MKAEICLSSCAPLCWQSNCTFLDWKPLWVLLSKICICRGRERSRPGLSEALQWVSQVADVLHVTLNIRCSCHFCVGVALCFLVVRWWECTWWELGRVC